MTLKAFVTGIPSLPHVNVRRAPGTGKNDIDFTKNKGEIGTCLEVAPDPDNVNLNSQIYQWFKVRFSDGQAGWVRDDLIDIEGDGTPFGYQNYSQRISAFEAFADKLEGGNNQSTFEHIIHVVGIPDWHDVNVRNGPTTVDTVIKFRVQKGTQAKCVRVQPDRHGDNSNGQIYQWFKLIFDDGRKGWVRDDLIEIEGDGDDFGYGFYSKRTLAFDAFTQLQGDGDIDKPPVFDGSVLCTAQIRTGISANVRFDATTSSTLITTLSQGTSVDILAVVDGKNNNLFKWLKIKSGSVSGYLREDLLQYSEACRGVLDIDIPPAPIDGGNNPHSTHERFDTPVVGWSTVSGRFGGFHKGTDLAGAVGLPIVAGNTGVVTRIIHCTACTPDKPSGPSQGLLINDSTVLNSQSWGWGFGNFVIVKYAWDVLPKVTQTALDSLGLNGAFAYVYYAHLASIEGRLNVGSPVSKGTQLGTLGNTGNSTGPHLHIEVVATKEDGLVSLSGRQRIDPESMFKL